MDGWMHAHQQWRISIINVHVWESWHFLASSDDLKVDSVVVNRRHLCSFFQQVTRLERRATARTSSSIADCAIKTSWKWASWGGQGGVHISSLSRSLLDECVCHHHRRCNNKKRKILPVHHSLSAVYERHFVSLFEINVPHFSVLIDDTAKI